jgi:hypothetical protein
VYVPCRPNGHGTYGEGGVVSCTHPQCPSCPDPPTCARLLDEKWRQAYQAVFRFGPCQPSMVFRYLRTLEGVSPPLALSHLTCQTTAKAFIATRTPYQTTRFILRVRTFFFNIHNSVRSHVLAWRAGKRYGYCAARGPRRGCCRYGQCDAPASSFLVLLAQAREPRSTTRTATSPSRDRVVRHPETGSLGTLFSFLEVFLLLRPYAFVPFRLSSVLPSS